MKRLAAFAFAALPVLAQGSLVWEHDLASALKRAQREKKQVFVDVWAEWCPPCQHLQKNVFPSPEAQKGLSRFVAVSLMTETRDRKPQAEAVKAAQRFRVEAFPTLVVLDADGKELKRQVGAFRTGADLAAWLGK
ncbi:MAG: thioredoxin family protein [Acidobacteria bacterium]|nr:thioredoxin family protein [Acidobacteriota bacterium]